jgi:hypothetical protein
MSHKQTVVAHDPRSFRSAVPGNGTNNQVGIAETAPTKAKILALGDGVLCLQGVLNGRLVSVTVDCDGNIQSVENILASAVIGSRHQ